RLNETQLQGASLIGGKLQGAMLSEARVWRARGLPGWNLWMALADVSNIDPHTMPWETDSTFAAWRDAVLKTIPETHRLDETLVGLLALDPAKEPEDVIKAQFWNDAVSAPLQGEEREKQLAAFLAALGCSSDGAPYVARGLIRNVLKLRSTGSHVAVVADRLYKGKSDPLACPGVKGFTDDDWANLSELSPDPLLSR